MRIGFVSDLHIDFNRKVNFIDVLKQLVDDEQLDELIIMGDTANGVKRDLTFYSKLKASLNIPFKTLVGNHDIYVDHARSKDFKEVQAESGDAYRQLDGLDTSLTTNPLITKRWVITGINGWYDYTFAKNFDEKNGQKLANNFVNKHLWPDQRYINGGQVDYNRDKNWVTDQIFKWQSQINQLNTKGKKVLVASHMLPTKRLTRSRSIPFYDRFLYPLGSERYRELFEQNTVQVSLSGHSHMPTHLIYHDIKYVNLSLGYQFQWHNPSDPLKELKRVMYILEDD